MEAKRIERKAKNGINKKTTHNIYHKKKHSKSEIKMNK